MAYGGHTSVTATIADGQSLSDAVELAGRTTSSLVAIVTPVGWTTAGLEFQGGLTADGDFFDVYTATGFRWLASRPGAGRPPTGPSPSPRRSARSPIPSRPGQRPTRPAPSSTCGRRDATGVVDTDDDATLATGSLVVSAS